MQLPDSSHPSGFPDINLSRWGSAQESENHRLEPQPRGCCFRCECGLGPRSLSWPLALHCLLSRVSVSVPLRCCFGHKAG